MKKHFVTILRTLLVLLAAVAFFILLQFTDNKYIIKDPVGQDGRITLTRENLLRDSPVFLTDGWKLTLNGRQKDTYVGEYANYLQPGFSDRVQGTAVYSITLHYEGSDMSAALWFPELQSRYSLYVNDSLVAQGTGTAYAVIPLKAGDTRLCLQVESHGGYLSGMYFPGAVSSPQTISGLRMVRTLFYAFAFSSTLALALFTLLLWQKRGNGIYRAFGAFCLSFCLYISYYFVHLFHMPFEEYWYLIEDLSFYIMAFTLLLMSAECAKLHDRPYLMLPLKLLSAVVPAISLLLCLFIPVFPMAAVLHGLLQNFYRILLFLWLTAIAFYAAACEIGDHALLLTENMVFGVGLLYNLLSSNHFEPVYMFWQLEWSGFFLVVIFAAMMILRNRRILQENEMLARHLEEQVARRTEKLNTLLEERRAFFFQLAHNLKAPLAATQSYIQIIERNDVGLDPELLSQINSLKEQQSEMQLRVESINALSQLESISETPEKISVNTFLAEMEHIFSSEAAVKGIYMMRLPANKDRMILAGRKKLVILMENLIANALSFTPMEGTITLSASTNAATATICVQDTGPGIEAEKLPHLFERFYVGRPNRKDGSGIGLYIVKLIAQEYGAQVLVESKPGQGAKFCVVFPAAE